MIRFTGVFLDTRHLTATFVMRYSERMVDGVLKLRDLDDTGEARDLAIIKEWKSARNILARFRGQGAELLKASQVELGKAWIESLPGHCGTTWQLEDDDYAQSVIRTRTALIVTPDAFSYSGNDKVLMGVGAVNVIEHRCLHSETNPSPYSRVHLIVDVKRPEPDAVEE